MNIFKLLILFVILLLFRLCCHSYSNQTLTLVWIWTHWSGKFWLLAVNFRLSQWTLNRIWLGLDRTWSQPQIIELPFKILGLSCHFVEFSFIDCELSLKFILFILWFFNLGGSFLLQLLNVLLIFLVGFSHLRISLFLVLNFSLQIVNFSNKIILLK